MQFDEQDHIEMFRQLVRKCPSILFPGANTWNSKHVQFSKHTIDKFVTVTFQTHCAILE